MLATWPIEAIDDKVMRAFIPWRRDYYSKFKKLPKNAKLHPTDTTLQWEMMLGKAIIRWADEQGLRGKLALPTVTFTAKKKRARPAFEIPEYRRLWRTMHKRISDAGDVRTLRTRQLLSNYVLVLANSGMRVGEANNLKLRDVMPFRDAKGRNNFRFIVRGKTGERDVILRSAAARRVDKILAKRTGENPNNFLFAMPKGTRIISLIDQFNMALKAGWDRTERIWRKVHPLQPSPFLRCDGFAQWDRCIRGCPQHGHVGPNNPAVLWQAGHGCRVCNEARGLTSPVSPLKYFRSMWCLPNFRGTTNGRRSLS